MEIEDVLEKELGFRVVPDSNWVSWARIRKDNKELLASPETVLLWTALVKARLALEDKKGPTVSLRLSVEIKPTRNSVILADFVRYCRDNPYLRFWQALRNWSSYHFIYAGADRENIVDTFNWEGKSG